MDFTAIELFRCKVLPNGWLSIRPFMWNLWPHDYTLSPTMSGLSWLCLYYEWTHPDIREIRKEREAKRQKSEDGPIDTMSSMLSSADVEEVLRKVKGEEAPQDAEHH